MHFEHALPEKDAVLIGAHVPGGAHWLMYDCAANGWVGVNLKGPIPSARKRLTTRWD
jgi:hypothetical protein